MASIVETSKGEADELMLLLMHCLPPDLATLWHTTEDILGMLRAGGITSYTKSRRIGILLRNQKRIIDLKPNEFNKKQWYCFNEKGKEYGAPVQQRDALREKGRPQIETNYFTKLGITFKFMKTIATNNATTSTAASNTTPAAATATNTTPPAATTTNSTPPVATATANMNNNINNNKTVPIGNSNKSSRPTISSEETGFFLARLDIVDDLVKLAEDHKTICDGSLQKIQKKCGFEVLVELHCDLCDKSYHVRSGPEPAKESPTETPRRGPKTNQLNMMMASAAHKAAIPVAHMLDLCHEVGCVSPSEKGLFKMMDQRNERVLTVWWVVGRILQT